MKRVLAVIDSLEVGGAQAHLLSLAGGMANFGYEMRVATSGNEPLTATFRSRRIPLLSLGARSVKHRIDPLFNQRLINLVSRGDFDLIHAHLFSASVAAAFAAPRIRLPLVITHHSAGSWQGLRHQAAARWADGQADAVISVASEIAPAVGAARPRVRIIANGVNLPTVTYSPQQLWQAKHRLRFPPAAYIVAFVGRLAADKNPLLFVETASLVARRCSNAYFLMVGDGPLRGAVETRVHGLELESRFVVAGSRPDVPELLQIADVLTLTSNNEGSPLVTLEAMAAAKPVVGTGAGDVRRQIADQETGFVCEPGDKEALAERLIFLLDAEKRQQLGKAGHRRVSERFSAQRMLGETAAVYDAVLMGSRRGHAAPSSAVSPAAPGGIPAHR